jgi:hypothetical protein
LALAADPSKPKSADAPSSEAAQPTRAQCLDAHRDAQELKNSGKLLEAQEHLLICSSGSCPGAVISDCGSWLAELEKMTPSMTFEVRVDGKEALSAKLFVDGQPVTDRAHAFKVNPGQHAIRVELPPFEPHEETVVLPEGQRMRLISVEFTSKHEEPRRDAVAAPPPAREPGRPTPGVVYPLLGVGVVGLASFGVFSALGKSEQHHLESSCSPKCTNDDLSTMKRWYLVGDISAGVGAAALLGAAIVYLARPSEPAAERDSARLALSVGPVGLNGGAPSSLGLSAARTW